MTTWLKYVLVEGGKAPERAHATDAGLDLFARGAMVVWPLAPHVNGYDPPYGVEISRIPLGVRVAIPEGHVGLLCARSSSATNKGLAVPNGLGIIDSGYTGELCALFVNLSGEDVVIEDGEKIAQLVVVPLTHVILQQVDKLDETPRGDGGFGSTNKAEVTK